MIDFLIGIKLWIEYKYYSFTIGRKLRYTCVNGNRGFISDKPFGSQWLTERSRVWMSRTKRGKKEIESSNGIMFDDSLVYTHDVVEIDNHGKYIAGILERSH